MTTSSLDIRLVLDPGRARQWHRSLAEELRRRGHRVAIALRPGGPAMPASIGLLLALEGFAHPGSRGLAGKPWEKGDLARAQTPGNDAADIEIDMTGRPQGDAERPTLAAVYGDALIEEAAVAALIAGEVPEIGIRDSRAPGHPMLTRPGIDAVHRLGASLDNLGARLAALFARAVDTVAKGCVVRGKQAIALREGGAWHAGDALRTLTYTAGRLLQSMLRRPPHWYVGWRRADSDRVHETLAIPKGGWTRLPDDGKRFYADPIAVPHEGRNWIFVEELPYATGRALISAVELGADGPVGTPRPVLERSCHLSYPFVFPHDGQMWMIPESAADRTVDLYRADQFPDRWTHVATLIKDVAVGDATIVQHNGRFWLFGTVGEGDASSWDALHIWSADRLLGPWTPHGNNPVLMDALGARPGGAFFHRHGELWRPAQDCTTGYGAGLALCRVTKLDDEGFAQEVAAVLRPGGPDWPGTGFHSLNWAAGIEVVDGCQDRRR